MYVSLLLCQSKLHGRIYFAWRFFRVFDGGHNNCYFDSAVKNTNMPQIFFSAAPFSFDRHNSLIFSFLICPEMRMRIIMLNVELLK